MPAGGTIRRIRVVLRLQLSQGCIQHMEHS